MRGWIKVYRKMLDNPIVCKDADHFAVWNYLLLLATNSDYDVVFNNERITLNRGQFLTSRSSIADFLGINEHKVDRILKSFKSEQQIEQLTSNRNRLITILNWDKYQNSEQQNEQQVSSKRATSEQQVSTNKNNNNIENVKEEYNNPPISPQGEWVFDKHSNLENAKHMLNAKEYDESQYILDNDLWDTIKDWLEYKDARKPKSSNRYVNAKSMTTLLNTFVKYCKEQGREWVIESVNMAIGNTWAGVNWGKGVPFKKEGMDSTTTRQDKMELLRQWGNN